MKLKARKDKHRAFRDKLRERKRLRKERRERETQRGAGWTKPVSPPSFEARPPGLPETKVALEDVTAVLTAAADCMVLAKRRKRGTGETMRLYLKHMKERGYTEDEARMALQVGEAAHG